MKIGILGGGQLARMLVLSAYQLGIESVVIDPSHTCSAKNIADVVNVDFLNTSIIEKHFKDVDCITYETENLPIEALKPLSSKYQMYPSVQALEIFQDRLKEKQFLNSLNIPTTEFNGINSWSDLETAIKKLAFPLVLKTRLAGYDGKGQAVICSEDEAKSALQSLSGKPLIVEKFINFELEVSVIAVRSIHGEILFYPMILNLHKSGILSISRAPYVNDEIEMLARKYVLSILEKLDYVGVITVEFFYCDKVLVTNEIAPRVHNSGHWTIEGADTSQFENHLRAIMGLPLGSTSSKSFSAMLNIIGKKPNIREILAIPGAHYHWYSKEPLDGRKLGHVTLCASASNEIESNIKRAITSLTL